MCLLVLSMSLRASALALACLTDVGVALSALLTMSRTYELDEFALPIERLIEGFPEQVAPYAVAISTDLVCLPIVPCVPNPHTRPRGRCCQGGHGAYVSVAPR
jgi:hypothetical protein